MKIPMQMGGVESVNHTFSTGFSDVNNRTRIIRKGDTITAYICVKYNQNITNANSYPVLSFDASLVPVTAVFTVAQMLGTIFSLNVNEGDHTIRIAKIVGNDYEANKGIYGEISWHIGQ